MVIAVAGCCCWLLAAGCWLISASCWLIAAGCYLMAVAGCCCWLLLLTAVARKFFEFFRDIVDLRLKKFCRRKIWIISGYCWFAAKTILQAKKYLNTFGRKSLWIISGCDDLRLSQFCRRKSNWIFLSCCWVEGLLVEEKWRDFLNI